MDSGEPPLVSLSVLSLNIWNNSGPWERRSEEIRRCIAELDPDLIGFQEILVASGVTFTMTATSL